MARHDYGPHRREDAPTLVEVLPPGKWPEPVRVPIAAAIIRQRAIVNTVAHHGRLSFGICRTCSLDEWDCRARRPGPDDHEFERPLR